jgi:hypothetical protein
MTRHAGIRRFIAANVGKTKNGVHRDRPELQRNARQAGVLHRRNL